MIRFVCMTLVCDGFTCGKCPEDLSRRRGCKRRNHPAPPFAAFCQHLPDGSRIDRYECPQSCKTAEHGSLFRTYLHQRDGRQLYPSLAEYPEGLLKRLEVVDSEVRALEAQKAEQAARARR